MADFQRFPQHLVCTGLNLVWPSDKMPPGKFPVLRNVRAITESALQVRAGLTLLQTPGAAHSLFRLNDNTPYNGGIAAIRVAGISSGLYAAAVGGALVLIDTGYSGDPFSCVAAQPTGTPQPFLYVMDRYRLRKINVIGDVLQVGIAGPNVVPSAVLAQPSHTVIDDAEYVSSVWLPAGNGTLTAIALRVNAHADVILYDAGTTGNALIALDDTQQLGTGMTIMVDTEPCIVQSVRPATVPTTIAAIAYDSGTTGLCTIQPAASLGSGHVQLPTAEQVLQRNDLGRGRYAVPRGTFGTPVPSPLTGVQETSAINFPVDCLVQLGTEWVRIISANMGPDGIQSFRCTTTNTHVVGEAVTGRVGLRVYLVNNHVAGVAVLDHIVQNQLGTVGLTDEITTQVGGVQTCNPDGVNNGFTRDLSLIGGVGPFRVGTARATQPDDEFHLSVRIEKLYAVQEVRVYLDVDPTTNNFTQNFYQIAFSVNDLIKAVQVVDATAVTTTLDALENQFVPAETARAVVTPGGYTQNPNQAIVGSGGRRGAFPGRPGSLTPQQQQLALGNNQWMELRWKVRDMLHVGTDESRSLANVTAAGIFIQYDGALAGGEGSTIDVAYDAFYLTGGYGADAAKSAVPYIYTYRYRSSKNGPKSPPAPPIPGSIIGAPTGILPRRQRVLLTATASGNADADKIDWWRFGGTLLKWTYIGTSENATPTFNDDYADEAVLGGDELEFDNFPLWPTVDKPRRGTCNVAGSAIDWVSGDLFNTSWSFGSQIKINGIPYTLYSSPQSTIRLYIAENAGALTNVPFELPDPTLLNATFAPFWGPFEGYYFSIDPNTNQLVWTKAYDPDTASDRNRLTVTSPSEPLVNGFVRDGFCFVWSSEDLFRIELHQGPNRFRAQRLPCGRGLWSPWAFCSGPEGEFFLAKDGIWLTDRGSPAVSLTNEDLLPLFPHDGEPGADQGIITRPNMAVPTGLRLTYVDGYVYFDYALS